MSGGVDTGKPIVMGSGVDRETGSSWMDAFSTSTVEIIGAILTDACCVSVNIGV